MFTSAVEVLWTARYDYQPDWSLPEHQHDHFQLIYFLGGAGIMRIAGHAYSIAPGAAFLVPPATVHSFQPESVVKTLDVKFVVKDQVLHRCLLRADHKTEEASPVIANLLERIRREGESGGGFYREMCDLYLTEVLIHFLRLDAEQSGKRESEDLGEDTPADVITQRTVNFIQEHYAEALDLRRIASAVGRSDRYIRRHFDEFLGVSPMRYLLHYRIRKAKDLIRHSDHALKEVAELVGFKTVHHFARAFHEICGETPGEWRRKYRSGICKDVCIHPNFSNKIWTVTTSSSSVLDKRTQQLSNAAGRRMKLRSSL